MSMELQNRIKAADQRIDELSGLVAHLTAHCVDLEARLAKLEAKKKPGRPPKQIKPRGGELTGGAFGGADAA